MFGMKIAPRTLHGLERPIAVLYGLLWSCMILYGILWYCMAFAWSCMGSFWHLMAKQDLIGLESSFLAVIDQNLFGLVIEGKAFAVAPSNALFGFFCKNNHEDPDETSLSIMSKADAI